MKRNIIAPLIICCAIPCALFAQAAVSPMKPVTDYLNSKSYNGSDKEYDANDLSIPLNVERSLSLYGVSSYTLLRNEMYARHGYSFKNPVLSEIFSSAKWYKADTSVGINVLTKTESRNVEYIKKIEDDYDAAVIAEYLSRRQYDNRTYYTSDAQLAIPVNVQLAINHLYLNPSRVFRNEIYARYGYTFQTAAMKKIFSKVQWYRDRSLNEKQALSSFSKNDFVNLELLRNREWIDILDSIKFSMPKDITVIPAVGMNAMFVKEILKNNEKYYFSNTSAWLSIEEKGERLDDHKSVTEELVSEAIVEKINKEKNNLKKLILYFSNKKYKGYADTIAFNHSDLDVPIYLKEAVKALDINWNLLLRKEIHARNGALFIDPKVGPIFRACPWYKGKYNLVTQTRSRFPESVKISDIELLNYSLLEGEELMERISNYQSATIAIAVDLQGKTYFVKIESVQLTSDGSTITLGYGFTSESEANNNSVENKIKNIIQKMKVDIEKEINEEIIYNAVGC
jgi:hypothetical protein